MVLIAYIREKRKKSKASVALLPSVRPNLHLRVDVAILLVVIVSAMEKVVSEEKNHPEPFLASQPPGVLAPYLALAGWGMLRRGTPRSRCWVPAPQPLLAEETRSWERRAWL